MHSVACSPFHRNIFLCCGAAGSVFLYSLLGSKPLLTLDVTGSFLHSVVWSRHRPLVFAAAAEDGYLYLFDLQRNTSGHVSRLSMNATAGQEFALSTGGDDDGHRGGRGVQEPPPAYGLAFNPRHPSLMACGDGGGNVRVFRLGSRFTETHGQEESLLDSIANVQEDGDDGDDDGGGGSGSGSGSGGGGGGGGGRSGGDGRFD